MINNIKVEKGITLITLVITVVLLIIITSTIAINSHTSLELSNLTRLENDIQALNDRVAVYYVANGTLPVTGDTYTKTEISADITNLSANDGDTYYKIDLSKLSNITINYGNYTYIINETSHNIYNLEGVTYNGAVYHNTGKSSDIVLVIDHEYFTQEQISAMIGKYVDYTPEQGTYSLITNSTEYAGTADNTSDFTTENFKWRIWGIDGNTLTLIADDVISTGGTSNNGTLSLYGAVGYNNGVKILNDICKNCYSNSSLGATGRSINIEDIENVLDRTVWKPEDYNITPYGSSKKYYTYGETLEYKERKKYPYILLFEEYSKIVNNDKTIENKKGRGITRSTQNEYYSGNTYTNEEADVSINIIMTFWYKRAATGDTDNFINQAYYNLIFNTTDKESYLNSYWVASRYTIFETTIDRCSFGIHQIAEGTISGTSPCNSGGGMATRNLAIRPMVEINLTQVSLDTTTTSGVDAQNAYKLVKR